MDPNWPLETRAKDLLKKMTLKEKVGQMAGTVSADLERAKEDVRGYCLGALTPLMFANSPKDLAFFTNAMEKFSVEETRLGTPLLLYMDAVHGHAHVKGATVFPHNLGLAATWDLDLAIEVGTITAREARATGIHETFSPICDIAREPRWGRTLETFGESPYLCSAMAAATVKGYQGSETTRIDREHVMATAKHFPAYSSPERGQDTAPVDISEYTFRTVHLPPFQAAISAGAWAVMACYNELNGRPVHGSKQLLTDLLRGELGFRGILVTDATGIDQLYTDHHTAESYEDAVRQGVEAGIDLDIFGGLRFASALLQLVENGRISERRIDESVLRILETKFRLGLFENPYVDPELASKLVGCREHRDAALSVMRKSITLLKNDGNLLPLPKDIKTILVTGPNADNVENQLGGWSNTYPPMPSVITVLEGIKRKVSRRSEVLYTLGSGIRESGNIAEARELAKKSDAAIAVVGEPAYIHEFWTLQELAGMTIQAQGSTESSPRTTPMVREQFPCRTMLDLPSPQLDLIKALHETGTPTVVVLITGRPLTIRWVAENVPAILMAYLPGTEGGSAIADVLFGDYNPGGKLPISVARSIGQLPVRHNYMPSPLANVARGMRTIPSYDPLFEFGHGLSYTKFEYHDLSVSPQKARPSGVVEVSVTVKNVGPRAGDEVVQLYVNDVCSSRVTPVKELKGFRRITLEPGESKLIEFKLSMEDLGVFQDDGSFVTEPGTFKVMIERLETSFEVIG